MKREPCDRHSTWTDFPGPTYACARCGWSEKAIEVRELERLLDNPRTFTTINRDEPALAAAWKRETTGCPDFQVQPVTVEQMEEFLRSTSAKVTDE